MSYSWVAAIVAVIVAGLTGNCLWLLIGVVVSAIVVAVEYVRLARQPRRWVVDLHITRMDDDDDDV